MQNLRLALTGVKLTDMKKELIFSYTSIGCIVPTSHKLNKDGYFRKMIDGQTWRMYHRYVWEQANGPIPDEYEIDHLCKNRACCNIEHHQCIHKKEHRRKDNMERSGNFTGIPKSNRHKTL